jgi:hypothetical protein
VIPPPPRCDKFLFVSTYFRPNLVQNIELENKNILKPYLSLWLKVLLPKPIKIVLQKSKKVFV